MQNISPSILEANSKIVGATYPRVQPALVPVGLEATQGPGAPSCVFKACFFGASRPWENDEVGWTTVRRANKKKRGSKFRA